MRLFKFGWLSSKERKELQELKSNNEKLKDLVTKQGDALSKVTKAPITPLKPYRNIFYSNKNITVVFQDGTVLSMSNIERSVFELIRDSQTKEQIEDILMPSTVLLKADLDDDNLVKDNIDALKGLPDFVVAGDQVFFKNVRLALPSVVIATFIEIVEKLSQEKEHTTEWDKLINQYDALTTFWLKLAYNPLPQSREDLLTFMKKNDVRISKMGNVILYRRIVTKGKENKELVTFISQEYYKVKKWKKSPKNYNVFEDVNEYDAPKASSRYSLVNNSEFSKTVGNLEELYKDLPNMDINSYKSYHSGVNGQMEIKIGSIYRIPEDEIDLNNGLCAAGGLHAAAVDYNYEGFGDTPIVVLVNPSKAITVPKNETGKLRTTEMFIACVNDKPHGQHFDDECLDVFDEEYHGMTVAELEEAVSKKSFERLAVQNDSPDITLRDLTNIKEMLKSRVKEVI